MLQCTGVADVVSAVRFAREQGLPICVRGSGHAVDGKSIADDAVAIDLGPMVAALVDPVARQAIVQGGSRWTAVDRETQLHGLAVTGGTISHTGVGGLTLGGGLGWMMRKYGTSAENVTAIDAVPVEGKIVRASLDENPDLFWGMRGGGGNFAIATSFEFKLHPLGPILLAGAIMHPGGRAREALRYWRDAIEGAPEEVASIATVVRAPVLPLFPPALQGQPLVIFQVCYLGDLDKAEEALRPFREWGPPAADAVHPQPYVAVQKMPENVFPQLGTTAAARWYAKSGHMPELTDETIDLIIEHMEASPSASGSNPDFPIVALWRIDGALRRTPEDAMAFTCTNSAYYWESTVNWRDPEEDDRWISWERDLAAALAPPSSDAVYLNFTIDEDGAQIRGAYGAEKYRRLAELKSRWDPDNVLRFNKNIAPIAT